MTKFRSKTVLLEISTGRGQNPVWNDKLKHKNIASFRRANSWDQLNISKILTGEGLRNVRVLILPKTKISGKYPDQITRQVCV